MPKRMSRMQKETLKFARYNFGSSLSNIIRMRGKRLDIRRLK